MVLRPAARLALVAMLALSCLASSGCFRVSSDLRAMRNGIMDASGGEWEEDVEFGVGALTFTLARAGLGFVELPTEARAALEAARSAEVGVYRLVERSEKLDRRAMIAAADKAMLRAGWERLLTVLHDGEMVIAYVPERIRSSRNIHVCVAVLHDRQLVLASARSDLEPLTDLALKQLPDHRRKEIAGDF